MFLRESRGKPRTHQREGLICLSVVILPAELVRLELGLREVRPASSQD